MKLFDKLIDKLKWLFRKRQCKNCDYLNKKIPMCAYSRTDYGIVDYDCHCEHWKQAEVKND